jgi:Ran GTPase-activating protein (RanGAP) involved in mRNA processing and transport
MSVLAVIIASNENRFASLTLRENILKDSAISVLASALIKNDSLVHLDVSQCLISPKGFQILFDAIGSSNSITSLQVGNLSNANRNRIGQLGT